MEYEELVAEIKQQSITKLPALLIAVVEQCVVKGVFAEGGIKKVINQVIREKKSA